jgi:CO/xanthine dehydrogenase FAD-binding subunit
MSGQYVAAATVEDAVREIGGGARPVAGGTDLVVGARQGKAPLPDRVVAIHGIDALRGIEGTGGGLRLGALVTHRELVGHPVVREHFTGLADASSIVGSHATRAQGTIGGNVMNASPAMDTGAPLLCHGAVAVLQGPNGTREVALDDLFTGPGKTTASADELLVAVDLPQPAAGSGSAYVRLEYRRQMEIAIVGAAAVVTLAGGSVTAAKIAITALAPTIHRVEAAEQALVGTDGGRSAASAAADAAAAASAPISDVRGSADYRRAMAAVITRRAIEAAIARAKGEDVAIPASNSTYASI